MLKSSQFVVVCKPNLRHVFVYVLNGGSKNSSFRPEVSHKRQKLFKTNKKKERDKSAFKRTFNGILNLCNKKQGTSYNELKEREITKNCKLVYLA